jgi:hypothetical protein
MTGMKPGAAKKAIMQGSTPLGAFFDEVVKGHRELELARLEELHAELGWLRAKYYGDNAVAGWAHHTAHLDSITRSVQLIINKHKRDHPND